MKYNNIEIVLATSSDLDGINNILIERCNWFISNNINQWKIDYYPKKYDKNYFLKQMNENFLYVAKVNDNIVGVMLIKKIDLDYWNDDNNSYYIHHLVTDTNIKGIGKLLLNFAIEQCKKDKKEYLKLDCYKTSKFLNKYYKKVGFKNVGSGRTGNYYYNLWEMKI